MNSQLSQSKLHDIVNMGLRVVIGVIFIVHGFGKFGNPGFGHWNEHGHSAPASP